jgi:hypothetical protein
MADAEISERSALFARDGRHRALALFNRFMSNAVMHCGEAGTALGKVLMRDLTHDSRAFVRAVATVAPADRA